MKIGFKINERQITFVDIKDLLISETEKDYSIFEETYYEVNVDKIDKKLFNKKRKDLYQETTRKLIIKALKEQEKDSKKYKKKFMTLMPKKTWPE